MGRVNDPLAAEAPRELDPQRQPLNRPATTEPPSALDEQDRAQLQQLAQRDREVRAHEAAHAAAGGGLAGSPTYSFARGPDGRLYAVGGEVRIDTSPVAGDPQATIDKARTIIQAATAPASPSTQDLRAAAAAQAMLVEAQAELSRQLAQRVAADPVGQDQPRASTASQEAESDAPAEQTADPRSEDQRVSERERLNAAAEARAERSREALREFAQQLEDLNSRLARVQQQLIESGAIAPERLLGQLLDTSA